MLSMNSRKFRYQSYVMTGRGSTTRARSQKLLRAVPVSNHCGFWNLPQPEVIQLQPSQRRKGSQSQARRTSPKRNRVIVGSGISVGLISIVGSRCIVLPPCSPTNTLVATIARAPRPVEWYLGNQWGCLPPYPRGWDQSDG